MERVPIALDRIGKGIRIKGFAFHFHSFLRWSWSLECESSVRASVRRETATKDLPIHSLEKSSTTNIKYYTYSIHILLSISPGDR